MDLDIENYGMIDIDIEKYVRIDLVCVKIRDKYMYVSGEDILISRDKI